MLNLVGKRNWFYLFSFLLVMPGVISLLIPPRLKPGIEFTSGTTFSFRYAEPTTTDAGEEPALRPRPSGGARAAAPAITSSSCRQTRSKGRRDAGRRSGAPIRAREIEAALSQAARRIR